MVQINFLRIHEILAGQVVDHVMERNNFHCLIKVETTLPGQLIDICLINFHSYITSILNPQSSYDMSERESHEESVFGTTKPTLDDEDDLIAALEDDESASFEAFREQRIQQLHDEYYRAKTRLSSGYGSFVEIKEEKNLMDLIASSTNIVVHFAKDDFARCKIMDDHLNTLATTHYNTRFVKIKVENSPFLVVKMGIKVLPCVLCWIDGKVVDRIVGFEGLGYTENTFTTKDLETRLLMASVVRKSQYVNLKNDGKFADSSSDKDLDDSE